MTISAICAKDVATLQQGATVQDAATLLTDRDIAIDVVGQGLAPASAPVESVMSTPLLTLREEDGVLESVSRMLSGLVSVNDEFAT